MCKIRIERGTITWLQPLSPSFSNARVLMGGERQDTNSWIRLRPCVPLVLLLKPCLKDIYILRDTITGDKRGRNRRVVSLEGERWMTKEGGGVINVTSNAKYTFPETTAWSGAIASRASSDGWTQPALREQLRRQEGEGLSIARLALEIEPRLKAVRKLRRLRRCPKGRPLKCQVGSCGQKSLLSLIDDFSKRANLLFLR